MYKKYKLGLCKNGVPCSTPGINTSGKLDVRDGISSYEDVLVKEKVRRCWQKIEDEGQRMTRQEDDKNETAWRTIRVFVSSTFTDFHSEREMLVKKVFRCCIIKTLLLQLQHTQPRLALPVAIYIYMPHDIGFG